MHYRAFSQFGPEQSAAYIRMDFKKKKKKTFFFQSFFGLVCYKSTFESLKNRAWSSAVPTKSVTSGTRLITCGSRVHYIMSQILVFACFALNCSQGPSAEKTGIGSLVNRSSCPPSLPDDPNSQGTELVNKKSKRPDDSHSSAELQKLCWLCLLNTHQSHKACCA